MNSSPRRVVAYILSVQNWHQMARPTRHTTPSPHVRQDRIKFLEKLRVEAPSDVKLW